MSSDMNNLLALMAQMSKQGKSNLSGMSSMTNFMDNPWIGLLTGTFDPLSQQSQQDIPESTLYNGIISDPTSPLTLQRVAQAIFEENQPVLKVQNEINSMVEDGIYSKDELKSWASQLAAEKADVDKAKTTSSKNNMFAKAGLPNVTEQYSDNPSLAPFSDEARNFMSTLGNQASSMRGEAKSSIKNMAGQNKKLSDQNLNVDEINKLIKQNAKGFVKKTGGSTFGFSALKRVFGGDDTKYKKLDDGTIVGTKPSTSKEDSKQSRSKFETEDKRLKSLLAKAGEYEKKYGKGKKAPVNATYGDLSNPENLAKYFEIQSKIQTANQLDKRASDYGGSVISDAERSGRNPLMDQMAQRMLAIRLAMGQ